jgi:hypothetical protein
MRDRYEASVIEAIQNSFGETESTSDFASVLLDTAKNAVEDNLPDYLSDLLAVKGDSYLEELDELNTEVWFKTALTNSIGFMLLSRCGFDAREYFEREDFSRVFDFSTPETVAILGGAASDISEMVLREIGATVKNLQMEERKQNRTFAKQPEIAQNIDRNKTTERSAEYGADLYNAGRLSDTRPDRAGSAETWEVWNAAAQLPERPQGRDLHRDDAVGQAEQPSGANRPAGERDDGDLDRADGESAGRDGEPESLGSDEMGGADEQHSPLGRGNRADRADLPLSGHNFNAPSDIPYFHEDEEKQELLRTSHALKNHRQEIAAFFSEHSDNRERGDFVKSFFDNTYTELLIQDERRVGYKAYDDLLHLWRGAYLSREKEVFIRWSHVAATIHGMLLLDKWLDRGEKPLPTEGEQIALIEQAEAEKSSAFALPQEAVDYLLSSGSSFSEGKFRIYEQFQKHESTEDNIRFLKSEYGTGGHSDAIPGSGLWESHDGKGIEITRGMKGSDGYVSVLLKWPAVAKRIGELISADRYLTAREKEQYPAYRRAVEARTERRKVGEEFNSIIRDYNDYQTQLGNTEACLNQYVLFECGNAFSIGNKTTWTLSENNYILPLMRQALSGIISEDTHLSERAEAVLEQLSGDLAAPLEPTYEEMNPPPKPEKEYRFSLGDTVYLGAQEFEILSFDDTAVRLFDSSFPLFNKELPRTEFEAKLKENPMNDHLLHEVEASETQEQAEEPAERKSSGNALWDEYRRVKEEHPDRIVLFQVGDFFEVMGDDAEPVAKALDIMLTRRSINADERVPMCGVPGHRLSTYADMLLDRGFDIAISDLSGNERKTELLSSTHKDAPVESYPVGRIEFLGSNGAVGDTIEYIDEAEFLRDIFEENNYGTPMVIKVYRHEDGSAIPTDFVENLDPPPQGFEVIDAPVAEYDRADEMLQQAEQVEEPAPAEPVVLEAPKPKRKPRAQTFDIHPEIPQADRHNFRITDDALGVGTPSERFQNNVAAIRLLKTLETEERFATPAEQEVLSKYVGWGGLADCFDEKHSRYGELKALLSEDEYASARESTLTAFYTPPVVIRSIYQALENMNFKTGNILEPSCGVGNFIGMVPDSMADSKLYGVELDGISGRIAQQLYQKSSIAVQGFEQTDLPDSFFDAAIGNVPFGQFKVADKRYDRHNFLIHDYFFARTLDKVRPGGYRFCDHQRHAR